jgi:hypothetical protein
MLLANLFRNRLVKYKPVIRTIQEHNPSMHNFNAAFVDCRYLFRLFQSDHHQAVYKNYKKEIIFYYRIYDRNYTTIMLGFTVYSLMLKLLEAAETVSYNIKLLR